MSIDLFFKDTQGLGVAIGGLITKSSYVGSKRKKYKQFGPDKIGILKLCIVLYNMVIAALTHDNCILT